MERSVAVESAENAVVQRACDCGGGSACAACAADEKLGVQTKLTLGAPGDAYEQEADQVADRVMSGTGLTGAPITATPLVQRMEAEPEEEEMLQPKVETLQRQEEEEEEPVQMKPDVVQRMGSEDEEEVQMKTDHLQRQEEEEEEPVQMKAATSGPVSQTGAAAAAVTAGGQALSAADRTFFEPRFGYDFSHVRLHTDASAQSAARGINARAYTLRNHIAFAPGEYSASTEGRRLMAHELVHTLQQGNGPANRVLQREPGAQSAKATAPKIPCATDANANCRCSSRQLNALTQAHTLAGGALDRTVQALTNHHTAMAAGGRKTSRMRRINRVLKRNLGVLPADDQGLSEALGALTKAHAFISSLAPATDIRCEAGVAGSPCDTAGASAYYKSGKVTFCSNQQRFEPYVDAANYMTETEEQSAERTDRIHNEKAAEVRKLRQSQGMKGEEAELTGDDETEIREEAEEATPGVEEAEGELALSRLAGILIHEAMHHSIDRGLIDVYMHQQYFTELGRDRKRGPPAKKLALQNPDSYVMLVYDLEERGNETAGANEQQLQIASPVRHTDKMFELPKPVDASQDPRLTIRPVIGRRLIGSAYGQSRAVVQELMSSFGVAYTELADPSAPLTGLARTTLDVIAEGFGYTIDPSTEVTQNDLTVLSTIAFALQQTYIEIFMSSETDIVFYRRFPGSKKTTYSVEVSKNADFKELGNEGRVREILSELPLDTTFSDNFSGSTPLIDGPVPTLSPNIKEAAIKLSASLGVLSV